MLWSTLGYQWLSLGGVRSHRGIFDRTGSTALTPMSLQYMTSMYLIRLNNCYFKYFFKWGKVKAGSKNPRCWVGVWSKILLGSPHTVPFVPLRYTHNDEYQCDTSRKTLSHRGALFTRKITGRQVLFLLPFTGEQTEAKRGQAVCSVTVSEQVDGSGRQANRCPGEMCPGVGPCGTRTWTKDPPSDPRPVSSNHGYRNQECQNQDAWPGSRHHETGRRQRGHLPPSPRQEQPGPHGQPPGMAGLLAPRHMTHTCNLPVPGLTRERYISYNKC